MLSIGAVMAATGNVALMAGLAVLPSPLLASVAALVTTPVQFAVDLVCHPVQVCEHHTLWCVLTSRRDL